MFTPLLATSSVQLYARVRGQAIGYGDDGRGGFECHECVTENN